MLTELQGEQERLSNTTKELIEEHNRKQKHIDVSLSFTCFWNNFLLNTARCASFCRRKNKAGAVSLTLPKFKRWELPPIELSETKEYPPTGINNTANTKVGTDRQT